MVAAAVVVSHLTNNHSQMRFFVDGGCASNVIREHVNGRMYLRPKDTFKCRNKITNRVIQLSR